MTKVKEHWGEFTNRGTKKKFGGKLYKYVKYVTSDFDLQAETMWWKQKGYSVRTLKKYRPRRIEIYKRKNRK